jgi:hypothetical protein
VRICHTKAQSTSLYYSGCSVFVRLVTFECIEQFLQFLLIIAGVGDISKLQLYIWSYYGLQAEIIFFFTLYSPLFFEVYALSKL